MRRRRTLLVALVAAALIVVSAGCSTRPTILSGAAPYTVGSDRTATNARTVETFHEIEANSAVRVAVKVGATPSVEVTTDDNLLPIIRTSVADGRLTVEIDGSISTHLGVDVTVVAPDLDAIIANASAVIRADGVVSPTLLVASTSAAEVSVTGTAGRLELHVLSGAQAKLYGLTVHEADVEIVSAGHAEIHATEAVRGSVSSGSVLWIDGDPPTVDVTTASAGEVKRR